MTTFVIVARKKKVCNLSFMYKLYIYINVLGFNLTCTFVLCSLRWFCHVDDDNYVNPEALLSVLSAFPQGEDIYVGKPSLDRPITGHELLDNNTTVTTAGVAEDS